MVQVESCRLLAATTMEYLSSHVGSRGPYSLRTIASHVEPMKRPAARAPVSARRPAASIPPSRSGDAVWKARFDQLRTWLEEHDAVYPERRAANQEEKRLGDWVSNQRKTGCSSAARTTLLESLPSWPQKFSSRCADDWNTQVAALSAWLSQHDGWYPDQRSSNDAERLLAKWVLHQRTGPLSELRRKALEEIPGWSKPSRKRTPETPTVPQRARSVPQELLDEAAFEVTRYSQGFEVPLL